MLVLLLTVIPSVSFAALAIKPGLWSIQSIVKHGGQEYDAGKIMKEAMAKMSPEQKKQMEAMMKKMGKNGPAFSMSDKGMQVCFSQEMLKNEEFLNQHQDQKCKTAFPVKTSKHVVAEFKCESGTSGTADWQVKDSTHYIGKVSFNDKGGQKTEVNYKAEFVNTDCGSIKPVDPTVFKK